MVTICTNGSSEHRSLEDVDLLVYIETELQQILHRRKGEDASILTRNFLHLNQVVMLLQMKLIKLWF